MIRTLKTWILVPALAAAAVPAVAQEDYDASYAVPGTESVWGTRPGEVMVIVSSVFSEEQDTRFWHEPMKSVAVHSPTALRLELGADLTFYLPISGGGATEFADLVATSQGQLLLLEYHPVEDTPRGMIHASWSLTPERVVRGSGHVPMTNRLYSRMLQTLGDEVPDTGIFAPLAAAQRRLELMVRNVAAGNGREVDELYADFQRAMENAGLPLEFYRMPAGGRASEEAVQEVLTRGYTLSALDYWNAAISKFRQNRIVNPTLNDFEQAWRKVPSSAKVMADFPGARRRPLSNKGLEEFRLIAGQKYLDAAFSSAKGADPGWTVEMLRRFDEEQQASGLSLDRFTVEGRPARVGDPDYIVRLARGETGVLGYFRAIWHRILAVSMPNATPT